MRTFVLFMFLFYLFFSIFIFLGRLSVVLQPCLTCHMLFVLLARCVVWVPGKYTMMISNSSVLYRSSWSACLISWPVVCRLSTESAVDVQMGSFKWNCCTASAIRLLIVAIWLIIVLSGPVDRKQLAFKHSVELSSACS